MSNDAIAREAIAREVDRLFEEDRKKHYGQLSDIPTVGGSYIPGQENGGVIRSLKKRARAALYAREWFKINGPADAPPLPLSMSEREALKRGGVPHILAWYARSLWCRDYDVLEHPSFEHYACGVMASEYAPDFITKNEELRQRFPPRPLDGLGPGLCWRPPKEHARTMEVKKKRRVSDAERNCIAEDRVVKYLENRPGRASTAANATKRLLRQWERERAEMIRRGDRRTVLIAGTDMIERLHRQLDKVTARSPSDRRVEDDVVKMFEHLPSDAAAWTAYLVTRFEAMNELGLLLW
jgi:hypothetical protein